MTTKGAQMATAVEQGEVTTTREALLDAFSLLADVVDRKEAVPVLAHVLIDACGDGLTLSATNIETSARIVLPGESRGMFTRTVNHRECLAFVKALPDGAATMAALRETDVRLTSAGSAITLYGYAPGEFPLWPEGQATVLADLPASRLIEPFKLSMRCAPDNEYWSLRRAISLSVYPGGVRVAASDGYQIVVIGEERAEGTPLLVPTPALPALIRFLGACGDEPVTIAADEDRSWWMCGPRTFYARLLDSSFPDLPKMLRMQTSSEVSFEVEHERFSGAVRRVSVLVEKAHQAIRLNGDSKGLRLSFSSARGEVGETVPVSDGSCEDIPDGLAINAAFLENVTHTLMGETLRLSMSQKTPGALLFTNPVNPQNIQHLVMPMRP
jgi:DNA polymerase-3 subunit beta